MMLVRFWCLLTVTLTPVVLSTDSMMLCDPLVAAVARLMIAAVVQVTCNRLL